MDAHGSGQIKYGSVSSPPSEIQPATPEPVRICQNDQLSEQEGPPITVNWLFTARDRIVFADLRGASRKRTLSSRVHTYPRWLTTMRCGGAPGHALVEPLFTFTIMNRS